MTAYIIRRLLYTVPIVFGVLLITFLLFSVVGGDVTVLLAGKSASPEIQAEIRHEYGWDKPLIWSWDSQFVNHFKNAVTFNFGKSWQDKERIIDKIKRGAGPSLSLTVPMFIGEIFITISLALIVAYLRGTWIDAVAVFLCVVGLSLPFLSFILAGQYFLAYKLDLFPIYFWPDLSAPQYVALPVLIGILAGLGGGVRFYRTVMLDEMRSDYVRTAFAKGLSARKVLFKHVLKNAMIPIITQTVLTIPFLFLGSLLLERFFGIPGLGYLTVEAIGSRDYQVINAITYIGALLFVVFNLITDICYALVDPRISLE
jgi:peptide/nickel transport system permease protein